MVTKHFDKNYPIFLSQYYHTKSHFIEYKTGVQNPRLSQDFTLCMWNLEPEPMFYICRGKRGGNHWVMMFINHKTFRSKLTVKIKQLATIVFKVHFMEEVGLP